MTTKELVNLNNCSNKSKLYLKMNTINSLKLDFTFVRMCEHIGEAHLFEFISMKAMKNEGFIYYHTEDNISLFEKDYKIKPSTQYKYLKLLVQKELITKLKNGRYKPNSKYIEYGLV